MAFRGRLQVGCGGVAHGQRSRRRIEQGVSTTIHSSPCCWRWSPCGRPSTSASPPRIELSTPCTPRCRNSACNTTSAMTPVSPSDLDRAASSACMPCRRHELMELAEASTDRALTDAECRSSSPVLARWTSRSLSTSRSGADFDSYGAGDGADVRLGRRSRISAPDLRKISASSTSWARSPTARGSRSAHAGRSRRRLDPSAGEPSLRPDVVVFEGWIPDWAERQAIDVSPFVDRRPWRPDFGEYLLSFGSSAKSVRASRGADPCHAIPMHARPKGLVFYPKAEFEAAGYEVPTTWDEPARAVRSDRGRRRHAVVLRLRVRRRRRMASTDFIESLVLRVGGVDDLRRVDGGEIPFLSPAVMVAGRLADLRLQPRIRAGWPGAISGQIFADPIELLHPTNPGDWDRNAGSINRPSSRYVPGLGAVAPGSVRTSTTSSCHDRSRPPDSPDANPSLYRRLVDRPEVRALMEFVANPEWGRTGLALEYIDLPRPIIDSMRRPTAARRSRHSIGTGALSGWRNPHLPVRHIAIRCLDAMPDDIGSMPDGSIRDRSGGNARLGRRLTSIDQVLADIDAEWAALREAPPAPRLPHPACLRKFDGG